MVINKKLKLNEKVKVNDENEVEKRKSLANTCLLLGSLFLVFFATTLIIGTIFNFVKLTLSFLVIILSFFVSIVWYWFISKQYQCKKIIIPLGFIAILCGCIFVSGIFNDLTYDGQTYHIATILRLINGFNPVYDHFDHLNLIDNDIFTATYPKAAELNAAALYKITGNIEKSKASNIVLIITTFLITLASLLYVTETKIKQLLVIAFLVAANPVSIYQSLSYMVDGQFACLISCFLFLIWLTSTKTNHLTLISLAATSILMINIKATGFVYTFIFSVGFLAFLWVYQKEKFKLILSYLTVAFLIGAIFVGYNPYVTNALEYHNPFYPTPLMGGFSLEKGGIVDLSTFLIQDIPENFHNQSPLVNLIRSIFSHQEINTAPTEFKIPFAFSIEELSVFKFADSRVSGFGPLFSGAIVLCFMSVLCLLKRWKFDVLKNSDASIKLLIAFLLVISILVNTYSWWARYAPQLWLLPIFSLLFLPNSKGTFLKYLRFLLMLTLIVNIATISYIYYGYQFVETVQLNKQLDYLASYNHTIKVDVGRFVGSEMRLNEHGIRYEKIQGQANLTPSFSLIEEKGKVYLPDKIDPLDNITLIPGPVYPTTLWEKITDSIA